MNITAVIRVLGTFGYSSFSCGNLGRICKVSVKLYFRTNSHSCDLGVQ